MKVRTSEGGFDDDARSELREIAVRLRRLAERARPLELVCHDLARIVERLAGAHSPEEIGATMVCCLVADRNPSTLWRPEAAPVVAARPPGPAGDGDDGEEPR
jgi:hypothetical protein